MTHRANLSLILLLFSVALAAQTPDPLRSHLQEAARATTLDAPGATPFHLKLTIDIAPQKPRPAQQGTVELWWSAPGEQRIVYDLTLYHATVVETGGAIYRTPEAPTPPYIVTHLLDEILHPIPATFDPTLFKLESSKRPSGKISLDCTSLIPFPQKSAGTPPTIFCFDNQRFRVKIVDGDQITIRQTIGLFSQRSVPLALEYSFLNHKVGSAHIDALEGHPGPYPESSITTGLSASPTLPAPIPSGEMQGVLLTRADPIYPQRAKEQHISGSVLLQALIGADGKIHDLSVVGSADDLLTAAAMDAARQWTYKPYSRDGVPTPVQTTVTVNFRFGVR